MIQYLRIILTVKWFVFVFLVFYIVVVFCPILPQATLRKVWVNELKERCTNSKYLPEL